MNVLVTDGGNRSSLAVTRALGRNGCRVVVADREQQNLSSCSKYSTKGYSVPDPFSQGQAYTSAIAEIVKSEAIDVIFPMTDQTISLLNQERDALSRHSILACPDQWTMDRVTDKSQLFRLAEKLKVPIPHTVHILNVDDFKLQSYKIDHFPVVIKSSRSKIQKGNIIVPGVVLYASSREELEMYYRTQPALQFPSLIQEKIIGPGIGLFTLYDKDQSLAIFSHKRLREKPPSGGVSVLSESVRPDEEMLASAEKLLSAVEWRGVAMIEYKRDLRDGRAKLMEINGRFWGSLQLAIDCNVNFPVLLLDYLRGGQLSGKTEDKYLLGHKLKWILGTLDHLLIRMKCRGKDLNLPSDSPSRWQASVEFFKVLDKNTSFDVFDRNDLGPFRFETRSYLRYALRGK